MKKIKLLPLLILSFFISIISTAQSGKPVKDYLSIKGPVLFDNKLYNLSWSSHPSSNFYKQEYLVKGDTIDKYKSMLMFDLLTGLSTPKELATAKIAELKSIKATNPFANYEIFDNPTTGEYMIDFVLTANDANGKPAIAERNVYRYTKFTGAAAKKGVLLFAISSRSYGNEIGNFFTQVKEKRSELVKLVSAYKIPVVIILP